MGARTRKYVRISTVGEVLPRNADFCSCGNPKDIRAQECRGCYSALPVEKVCTGCRQLLPISMYYFRRATGKPMPECKACVSARPKPERQREYERKTRIRPGHYKRVAARLTARRRSDPLFKLAANLRQAVRNAVKLGAKKDAPTLKLIGCSVEEFRAHIEDQWRHGMSWANWGQRSDDWQLDHIRPVSSFDLSDSAELRKCFHFTNFQPLWTYENARKRDKWEPTAPSAMEVA